MTEQFCRRRRRIGRLDEVKDPKICIKVGGKFDGLMARRTLTCGAHSREILHHAAAVTSRNKQVPTNTKAKAIH